MTFATYLTLFRILALIPLAGAVLLGYGWVAVGLYALAAITDFFDGWVARKYNQTSDLGAMLDPIADKMMVATVPLLLAGVGGLTAFGILAALAILWREFLIAGLREHCGKKGIAVPVSRLAKYKTTLQLLAYGLLLVVYAAAANHGYFLMFAELLLWASAILTWVTGWNYLQSVKN